MVQEIAEIINEADIGKVDTIAAASMTIYIHSDKGEYVIPCERSYDLSAAYLGREEMSYDKGVLIPFEEYERVCVNIDKNDRDDTRDFKYAVDKTVIEEELKGDTIYTIFSLMIDYLNEHYRRFMKCIWQGE